MTGAQLLGGVGGRTCVSNCADATCQRISSVPPFNVSQCIGSLKHATLCTIARRASIERYLNRLAAHPEVARSEVRATVLQVPLQPGLASSNTAQFARASSCHSGGSQHAPDSLFPDGLQPPGAARVAGGGRHAALVARLARAQAADADTGAGARQHLNLCILRRYVAVPNSLSLPACLCVTVPPLS